MGVEILKYTYYKPTLCQVVFQQYQRNKMQSCYQVHKLEVDKYAGIN